MKYDLSHRLEAYRTKIDKRDIVRVNIKHDPLLRHHHGVLSADLLGHRQLAINVDDDEVTLIGKDGDIKSRLRNMDLLTLFPRLM